MTLPTDFDTDLNPDSPCLCRISGHRHTVCGLLCPWPQPPPRTTHPLHRSKCNKVRCLHCGYVRAKNTTRQIEHLQECQAYLATPEAQAHVQAQQQPPPPPPPQQQEQHAQAGSTPSGPGTVSGPSQILNGQHPNPNLQVNRRGPHAKRTRDGQLIAPTPPGAPHYTPSLTSHLLAICSPSFTQATQQPFLSHAGCGSLAIGPCSQWLAQDAHMARGYIRFIGQLLAKMRLPHAQNSQFHPMYRTMDLLISALNNTRREMQFFEITATKYGLVLGNEPPSPVTRALLDMFVSVSSTSASLLEGMVALWATQHVSYRTLVCHPSMLITNSVIAPPGNTLTPSAAPFPPPRTNPTSSPSSKPSFPIGYHPLSLNSLTLHVLSLMSSQTSQRPATEKRKCSAARKSSDRRVGSNKNSGPASMAWARKTRAQD